MVATQVPQYVAPSYTDNVNVVVGQPPVSENTYYEETTNSYVDNSIYEKDEETTEKKAPLDGRVFVETENPGPGAGIVDTYKKSYVNEENDRNDSDDEGNVDFTIPAGIWTEIKIPLNVYGIDFKVYKGTYNNVTRNDEMIIKAEHVGGSVINDTFYIDGMDIIPNED